MKKLSILFSTFLITWFTAAQSVAINDDGSTPNSSAMLEVKSAAKGLLIPRIALTATNVAAPVVSPLTSLLIYNTATAGSGLTSVTPGFYFWSGSAWERISSASTPSNSWALNGNAGTTNFINFIGTTDEQPLRFKVNNQAAGFIHPVSWSTAYGLGALAAESTGGSNTGIGYSSLFSTTSGSGNTAHGLAALYYNTTGHHNTAIGTDALYANITANENTAVGAFALFVNTASGNTAVGANSLKNNTTGLNNVAVGHQALLANDIGAGNTAVGVNSLQNNLNSENTAIGVNSLKDNISGTNNTASGFVSLASNTSGNYNTAAGSSSLAANTEGNLNAAFGYASLIANTTGAFNTAFGANALLTNITGIKNTVLGTNADVSVGDLENATAIGFGAIADASNKVRIGNADVTVIEGQVPFTTPSDGRFKSNVTESVKGLDFIMKLRPVVYNLEAGKMEAFKYAGYLNTKLTPSNKSSIEFMRQSGFIAQEVEKAAIATGYDFNGIKKPVNDQDTYGLSYAQFVVPLVKAMQEQQTIIESQNDELQKLKKQVEELAKLIQTISTNK